MDSGHSNVLHAQSDQPPRCGAGKHGQGHGRGGGESCKAGLARRQVWNIRLRVAALPMEHGRHEEALPCCTKTPNLEAPINREAYPLPRQDRKANADGGVLLVADSLPVRTQGTSTTGLLASSRRRLNAPGSSMPRS